jgi:hypothetical protein
VNIAISVSAKICNGSECTSVGPVPVVLTNITIPPPPPPASVTP